MSEQTWSRRRFMVATAASVAIAAASPSRAPGFEKIRPMWLDYSDLEPLLGERVRMVGASGQVLNARVIDVADRTATHRGVTVNQYSVLMRTGLTEPVEDYTFRIEHPEWGSCELFCNPVMSNSRGIHYEATLGRLAD